MCVCVCIYTFLIQLTIIPQESDVEIITYGNQPQSIANKVAQEPVRVYDHNI